MSTCTDDFVENPACAAEMRMTIIIGSGYLVLSHAPFIFWCYIYIYICVHVCMYVCMYIYIYIYILENSFVILEIWAGR